MRASEPIIGDASTPRESTSRERLVTICATIYLDHLCVWIGSSPDPQQFSPSGVLDEMPGQLALNLSRS
jgi:hypothetical protein